MERWFAKHVFFSALPLAERKTGIATREHADDEHDDHQLDEREPVVEHACYAGPHRTMADLPRGRTERACPSYR